MQDKKQQNQTWNNRLVQNWKRNTSRCILSPCLFKFYSKDIMQNAGLDDLQAGIKEKCQNLRYAYDTTLMAESEEELKRLLMQV